MARDAYPLKAALQLREVQLNEAKAALQQALHVMNDAERRFREAEDALANHIRETEALRRRSASQSGPRSAAELDHQQKYLQRRRVEEGALRESRDSMHAAFEHARTAADDARSVLADARANRKAIETHREKWLDARKAAAEVRAEEEAADVISGRRK